MPKRSHFGVKVFWSEGLRDGGSNPDGSGSAARLGGGIDAVLELGEGARGAGAGPSGRQIVAGTAALLVGVWRELGFGGGGAVALAVHVDGLLEASDVFGGEDEGFGVDAGLEAVHGGDGLACDGGAADRFWGVTAVSFDLADCRDRKRTRLNSSHRHNLYA